MKKEIIEGNKLIAEFMGLVANTHDSGRTYAVGDTYLIDGHICAHDWQSLKYHLSWDWLMPVVEKIEELHCGNFHFYIVDNECDIAFSSLYDPNFEEYNAPNFSQKEGNKLTSTWCAVVEFIKWYNGQA